MLLRRIRSNQQTSPTAGTLSGNTKLPFGTLHVGTCLLTQSKHGISAMDLRPQLGVSYDTFRSDLRNRFCERLSGQAAVLLRDVAPSTREWAAYDEETW